MFSLDWGCCIFSVGSWVQVTGSGRHNLDYDDDWDGDADGQGDIYVDGDDADRDEGRDDKCAGHGNSLHIHKEAQPTWTCGCVDCRTC